MAIYYNDHKQATVGGGLVNYSITEQDTGLRWINGKPIYQKTYYYIEGEARTSKNYDISSNDIDLVIESKGALKFGSGGGNKWYTAPYNGGSGYYSSISATSTQIDVVAEGYTFTEAIVTLLYTKTTDQANPPISPVALA